MTKQDIVNLLRKRIKYGLNQGDLAKELGISQSYLSEVLTGKRGVGEAIAKKLGLEACYKKVKK